MGSSIEIEYEPYEKEYSKNERDFSNKYDIVAIRWYKELNTFKGICHNCHSVIRQDESESCCSKCGTYVIW